MNKFLLIIFLSHLSFMTRAQEFSFKPGKVTKDELTMTSYAADTSAAALVIYNINKSACNYSLFFHDFVMKETTQVKMKVLKQEGRISTFVVQYNADVQKVTDIEGVVYNIDDKGKITKSKLKDEYISVQKADKGISVVKFALPNVNVGSVFEYSYVKSRKSIIPDTKPMQLSFPVKYALTQFSYPNYFQYNSIIKGSKIKGSSPVSYNSRIKPQKKHRQNLLSDEPIDYMIVEDSYVAYDLKSLPKENSWLYCPADFSTKVNIEFKGVHYNNVKTPGLDDWSRVDSLILDITKDMLSMKSPYTDKIDEIVRNSRKNNTDEIVAGIFKTLKSEVLWNNEYGFVIDPLDEIYSKRSCNSISLNLIMLSMLKYSGIAATPVVLPTRSKGRFSKSMPSIQYFNTMVLAYLSGNKIKYIDVTCDEFQPDALSRELLVEQARVVHLCPEQQTGVLPEVYSQLYSELGSLWVNLVNVSDNSVNVKLRSAYNFKDSIIIGECTSLYTGIPMLEQRNLLQQMKDSAEYTDILESRYAITVVEQSDTADYKGLKETFSFVDLPSYYDGNSVMINPFIIDQLIENPLQEQDRDFPWEYKYPETFDISSFILLQDCMLKKLPDGVNLNIGNKCFLTVSYAYIHPTLLVEYHFKINRMLFTAEDYTRVSKFFDDVVKANNTLIEITQQ